MIAVLLYWVKCPYNFQTVAPDIAGGVYMAPTREAGRQRPPMSQGTLALTKYGCQRKVKDTSELAKVAHCRI